MEALMSMDDESLDYVLESCDAEELEIISDAMEMKIADRNDPDVKEYIQNMKEARKDFAGDRDTINALKKSYKDSTRMILDHKQKVKDMTNRQNERLADLGNQFDKDKDSYVKAQLKSIVREMTMADRNDPDVQEYMRKRKESREELMRRFPNNPKLRKKISETTKRSDKEMCRMSIKNREDYKNDIERIKNASNERLNKGLDEINSYFNPKIQALQKNIDELKRQK